MANCLSTIKKKVLRFTVDFAADTPSPLPSPYRRSNRRFTTEIAIWTLYLLQQLGNWRLVVSIGANPRYPSLVFFTFNCAFPLLLLIDFRLENEYLSYRPIIKIVFSSRWNTRSVRITRGRDTTDFLFFGRVVVGKILTILKLRIRLFR